LEGKDLYRVMASEFRALRQQLEASE